MCQNYANINKLEIIIHLLLFSNWKKVCLSDFAKMKKGSKIILIYYCFALLMEKKNCALSVLILERNKYGNFILKFIFNTETWFFEGILSLFSSIFKVYFSLAKSWKKIQNNAFWAFLLNFLQRFYSQLFLFSY